MSVCVWLWFIDYISQIIKQNNEINAIKYIKRTTQFTKSVYFFFKLKYIYIWLEIGHSNQLQTNKAYKIPCEGLAKVSNRYNGRKKDWLDYFIVAIINIHKRVHIYNIYKIYNQFIWARIVHIKCQMEMCQTYQVHCSFTISKKVSNLMFFTSSERIINATQRNKQVERVTEMSLVHLCIELKVRECTRPRENMCIGSGTSKFERGSRPEIQGGAESLIECSRKRNLSAFQKQKFYSMSSRT